VAIKALRIFISIYTLLKSERLSVGAKLTVYKALITSVLTYASPAWELEADSYLSKLQRLQNKVRRTIRNPPRRTPTRDLHMAFKIPYLYDFVTKLCREQATVILNHENVNIRNISEGEARHGKYKRLRLSGGQAYDRLSKLWLYPWEVCEHSAQSAVQNLNCRSKKIKNKKIVIETIERKENL
jgi:hypothetical protein